MPTRSNLRERMTDALKNTPAAFADLRVERRQVTRIVYRDDGLETIDTQVDQGGIARALLPDGGWGVATFTLRTVRDLKRRVRQAWEAAQAATEQHVELAPVEPVEAEVKAQVVKDFRQVPVEDKLALLGRYHAQLRQSDPCIHSALTEYRDVFSQIHYANSEGTYVYQEKPTIDLQLSAVAGRDGYVQRAMKSLALAAGFEAVENRDHLAREAAQLACDLLDAEPVRGGRYTIVLDPALAGLFIHEAFGHLSEADFIIANPRAQEKMSLGQCFGPPELNVVDDASVPGLRGSLAYDDEGVSAHKTYLIREGALVGRLHSRETAAELGERPTGNARATSYRYPPIVRMTNTAIEPGKDGTLPDLIHDVELGLYACDWLGGEMAIDDFSFVAKYAYMIRHGQLAEMVRDVTFTGNVFETLQHIDRIGSDFAWDSSSGDCGKGQEGLPVCDGGPHIRIQDVLVGGK
jgi:TldD protein